jgi:hypothetical protein
MTGPIDRDLADGLRRIEEGRLTAAVRLLRRVIAPDGERATPKQIADALVGLGKAARAWGQPDRAASYAKEALYAHQWCNSAKHLLGMLAFE